MIIDKKCLSLGRILFMTSAVITHTREAIQYISGSFQSSVSSHCLRGFFNLTEQLH